jgi:hypothetical protein
MEEHSKVAPWIDSKENTHKKMQWSLCTLHFSTSHETSKWRRAEITWTNINTAKYKNHKDIIMAHFLCLDSSWDFALPALSSPNAKLNCPFLSSHRERFESQELKHKHSRASLSFSWEYILPLSLYPL